MDYQRLFLDHLDFVDRSARYIARRQRLSASDAEEFSSIVRLKLIDDDFAVLRKFQGRSNLSTYLITVIQRSCLDFCVERWGKWRASAAAERLGPVAVMLEQLQSRDGMTFDEAVKTLQTNHRVAETRDELQAMAHQLPSRRVRRVAGEQQLWLVPAHAGGADAAPDRHEDQALVEHVNAVIDRAVAVLSPRQQLILKLRYQDGLPVAQIGRLLQIDARLLYKRLESIIHALRDKLRQEGIDSKDIDRIAGHPAIAFSRIFEENAARSGDRDDGSV